MPPWSALLALSAAVGAPPPDEPAGDVVIVQAPTTPPGTRTVGEAEIATTPVRSPLELARALPGLHLSAHGGRGKAWQFLYRGFDAEHGADIAVSVDGVPLNEPSHIHAHGYVDAELVPWRLVRGMSLRPGSDRAEVGPFGVAASVDMQLGLERTGGIAHAVGGTDRSGGLTLAFRPRDTEAGTFLLAEIDGGAGVTDARDWRMARVAGGAEATFGRTNVQGWLLAYSGFFDTPGALRSDDLEAERVGLYDGYDDAGDGRSDRVLGQARVTHEAPRWQTATQVWAGARRMTLRQNFTGRLQFPDQGDRTRQDQASGQLGLQSTVDGRRLVADHPWSLGGGIRLTHDAATQSEDRLTPDDEPWQRVRDGWLQQLGFAGWVEGELGWRQRLRLLAGLRAEGWWQRVAPQDGARADVPRRTLGTPLPRVRVEGRPHDRVTLFAGWGRAARPPRADGGVFGALVTADTVQGGLIASPVDAWSVSATAFWNRLDDEQVFDHVSGRFVAGGATRRVGAELLTTVRPVRGLALEGALTWADGRFTATDLPVPFAPRWMGNLHVGAHAIPLPVGTLDAGLRTWVLGRRPLTDGFVSRMALTGSALLRWDVDVFSLALQVDNVFGNRWRDGEFIYASDWDPDRPRSALPLVHVTAGTPTAARLHLEVRL